MNAIVKELIDRIKSDGIQSANAEAEKLISEAQAKAESIIKEAEAQAKKTKEEAEAAIARQEQSSKDALAQASRDTIIGVKTQLGALAEALISEVSQEALNPSNLEPYLLAAIEAWSKDPEGVEIQLPEKDVDEMTKKLQSKLSKVVKAGVDIKPASRMTHGFRIGGSQGDSFYNFTPQEIAAVLGEMVTPKLKAILDEAAGES